MAKIQRLENYPEFSFFVPKVKEETNSRDFRLKYTWIQKVKQSLIFKSTYKVSIINKEEY